MSIEIQRTGILFVLSAPSGGGKSTVLKALRAEDATLGYSVSATTRPPRPGETHGKDYFFYSVEEFHRLIRQKAFYEWAVVHKHLYGTLRKVVDAELDAGRDVLLDIDVQGGLSIKRLRPDAVLIFLLPPSMAVLETRLRGRKSDSNEVIELRLRNARHELTFTPQYDYALINEDLTRTVHDVRSIIEGERMAASRLKILTEGEDIRIPISGLFPPEGDSTIDTPTA